MQEEKRPYHDGLSFPSANIPGITPESAFTDGYLTALHTMDEAHSRVRIGDDGKASDMNPETEMSPDGCNPVSKDSEMERAHDGGDDMIFPAYFPVCPVYFRAATPVRYHPSIFPAPDLPRGCNPEDGRARTKKAL